MNLQINFFRIFLCAMTLPAFVAAGLTNDRLDEQTKCKYDSKLQKNGFDRKQNEDEAESSSNPAVFHKAFFCHKIVEMCFRRSGKGVKIFAEGCCRPIAMRRFQRISGIMAKISIFFFSILTIAFRVEFNALSSECNALNLAQGFTDLPMPNVLSKHFKELVCFLRCY